MLHSIDQANNHTRKQHNTKRTRADGLLLRKRDGQVAYIEYHAPFAVAFMPSIEGGLEQVQCRSGDSSFTIEGRNLWPIFEDLQSKLCDQLQESEQGIESITFRLWF